MSKGQARTVRFKTLYGGQFTLSTELLKPNIKVLMKLRVILVHHVKHVTNPATQLCVTRLCHILYGTCGVMIGYEKKQFDYSNRSTSSTRIR